MPPRFGTLPVMDYLWTPWRYTYVTTADQVKECVFCSRNCSTVREIESPHRPGRRESTSSSSIATKLYASPTGRTPWSCAPSCRPISKFRRIARPAANANMRLNNTTALCPATSSGQRNSDERDCRGAGTVIVRGVAGERWRERRRTSGQSGLGPECAGTLRQHVLPRWFSRTMLNLHDRHSAKPGCCPSRWRKPIAG